MQHLCMVVGNLVVTVILHTVYTEVIAQLVALGLQSAQFRIHLNEKAMKKILHAAGLKVDNR